MTAWLEWVSRQRSNNFRCEGGVLDRIRVDVGKYGETTADPRGTLLLSHRQTQWSCIGSGLLERKELADIGYPEAFIL